MKRIMALVIVLIIFGCGSKAQDKTGKNEEVKITIKSKETEKKQYPVTKTEEEWKAHLSDMQFYVLRKKGTERAFTGQYNKFYEDGFYVCAGCGVKLYESKYKFNSGTGWPSFDRGYDEHLEYETDRSFGMLRTELICSNCGGHLGHVFNDGPPTTGMRHCINSASLQFVAANAPKG